MALEACYWGKTLFQIGPSPYAPLNIGYCYSDGLNCAKKLNTIAETNENIAPKDKKNCIVFASYLMGYQDKLEYFEFKEGIYKVKNMNIPI